MEKRLAFRSGLGWNGKGKNTHSDLGDGVEYGYGLSTFLLWEFFGHGMKTKDEWMDWMDKWIGLGWMDILISLIADPGLFLHYVSFSSSTLR